MPGNGFASARGLLLFGDRGLLRTIGRLLGISFAATEMAAPIRGAGRNIAGGLAVSRGNEAL